MCYNTACLNLIFESGFFSKKIQTMFVAFLASSGFSSQTKFYMLLRGDWGAYNAAHFTIFSTILLCKTMCIIKLILSSRYIEACIWKINRHIFQLDCWNRYMAVLFVNKSSPSSRKYYYYFLRNSHEFGIFIDKLTILRIMASLKVH